jgi:hypothetical protein
MNINIQINDSEPTNQNVVANSQTASIVNEQDGGASKALTSGGSTVSSTDSLDIGAPPQWLSDALAQKSDTSSFTSAQPKNEEDGGAGPSANSFN